MFESSSQAAPQPIPGAVQIFQRNESFCAAAAGNVVAILWNQSPTVLTLTQAELILSGVVAQHPTGIALMVISRAGKPVDQEAVKVAAENHTARKSHLLALAVVQENKGILSGLVRVSMQMIALLAGSRTVVPRFFATPGEAASFLGATLAKAGKLSGDQAALPGIARWLVEQYPPPATLD